MTDVFHRGIHISDPKILYSRINKNLLYAKKKPFSKNVLKLLKPWDPPNFSSWKIDYSMTDTVSSYCLPKEWNHFVSFVWWIIVSDLKWNELLDFFEIVVILLESLKLISRKIWVFEKFCNFHTVHYVPVWQCWRWGSVAHGDQVPHPGGFGHRRTDRRTPCQK